MYQGYIARNIPRNREARRWARQIVNTSLGARICVNSNQVTYVSNMIGYSDCFINIHFKRMLPVLCLYKSCLLLAGITLNFFPYMTMTMTKFQRFCIIVGTRYIYPYLYRCRKQIYIGYFVKKSCKIINLHTCSNFYQCI